MAPALVANGPYVSERGEVVYENNMLDDLVIMRADGTPTFHFCNVIDDRHSLYFVDEFVHHDQVTHAEFNASLGV